MIIYWKLDDSLCPSRCGCKIDLIKGSRRICAKCGVDDALLLDINIYKTNSTCCVINDEKLERFILSC